ncbi:MAG: hypothetical protein ACK4QW_04525 [Alphaproteobacteria bacterium]
MHYVAMMAVAAVISIAGMRSAEDLRMAYGHAAAGQMTEAAAYAVKGLRRALREADNRQVPAHLRSFVS